MKSVIVMMGVSGSGKSTYLRENHPCYEVCSADHYFTDEEGQYVFDPRLLPEAHAACLRGFVDCLRMSTPRVAVDNTNCNLEDVAPYIRLAQAYGYDVRVVHMDVDPGQAAARNVHGVPLYGVLRQDDRLYRTLRHWPWGKFPGVDVVDGGV